MSIINLRYNSPNGGGGGGWQPGVNTMAYYPLNSTYTDTDQSGNGNDGTTTGTLSYDSLACQFSSGNYISIPGTIPTGTAFTVSNWYYTTDNSGHQNVFYCENDTSRQDAISLFIYNGDLYSRGGNRGGTGMGNIYTINNNTWYNVVTTYDGSQLKFYVNGTHIDDFTRTIPNFTPDECAIGKTCNNEYCIGKISNLIIEDKCWTATEILDYFNQTKSLYGIS